jgi:hypothetical protein
MAIILAISFELGQAAVLFSLLTSKNERGKVMPWVLMGIFTLVQVLGNVYSSYKHIILDSPENLRFFKEPIFIWTTLPDDQATVIVTYIVGAILPICALLLTSTMTNHLGLDNKEETETKIETKTEDKEVTIPNINETQNEKVNIIENEDNKDLDNEHTDIVDEPKEKEITNPVDFEIDRQSKFINL